MTTKGALVLAFRGTPKPRRPHHSITKKMARLEAADLNLARTVEELLPAGELLFLGWSECAK